MNTTPFVNSVFHPSDFSSASENAFAHALAISLLRQAQFTILHVGKNEMVGNEWRKFPAVRSTLERWGLLEKGSPKSDVFDKFALDIRKVDLKGSNPLKTTVDYLHQNPSDMIVLSTEGREGMSRLVKPSMAEEIARTSQALTLFVPSKSKGFISFEDGHISLKRILVPIDFKPDPAAAVEYATRAAGISPDAEPVEIILLHVNEVPKMPEVKLPESSDYTWVKLQRSGDPIEEILKVIDSSEIDLLIMPTAGHDGFMDAVRGSTSEQLLRKAPCAVLSVPCTADCA